MRGWPWQQYSRMTVISWVFFTTDLHILHTVCPFPYIMKKVHCSARRRIARRAVCCFHPLCVCVCVCVRECLYLFVNGNIAQDSTGRSVLNLMRRFIDFGISIATKVIIHRKKNRLYAVAVPSRFDELVAAELQ